MNHQQAEKLWDEYRDNALSPSDRAAFEQYLADNPSVAASYHAESDYLQLLTDDSLNVPDQDPAFTRSVLATYTAEKRSAVIARIRPILATAAAVVIVGFLVFFINSPQVPTPSDDAVDPVSQLVLSVNETFEDQTETVSRTIKQTASLINLDAGIRILQEHDAKRKREMGEKDNTPKK